MPVSRTLVYERDEDTGEMGFRPTWFENATPAQPRELFHDMFEHFSGQRDPVSGELEAMGAYVAYRFDAVKGITDMASVICFTLNDMLARGLPDPVHIRTRALSDDFSYVEGVMRQASAKGVAHARAEIRDFYGQSANTTTLESALERLEGMEQRVLSCLRNGFRKAHHRYGHTDLWSLGQHVRELLAERGNRLMSSELLSEGDTIRVSVDVRRYNVRFFVNGMDAENLGYLW